MATGLATRCSACGTVFRVVPDQLRVSEGWVRCGRCSQVFNGFQVLERFPDDDTGGRLIAEHEGRRLAEDAPAEPLAPGATVDLALFDEEPAAAAPEPVPATAPAATPQRRTRRFGYDFSLEVEPPPPPPRAWRFAAAFLALVLVLELTYAFRGPIAQRYPVLRPAMESVCARIACSVPWSREEALIKLEDSELLEVPGKPNEIALGARIRNLATVAQEYPHLELSLTDLTGQAALRRVLRPTDYLGRPLAHGEVMAPGGEVALQLRLETPRLKATGYALLVFYP
jgi:predicted Zn finger-like uncharacterized protein